MKLLIISELYLDETNAVAHCTRMLVQGMIDNNAVIDLICVREQGTDGFKMDKQNNLCVYPIDYADINESDVNRGGIIKKIKKLPLIPQWPLEEPKTAKEIIKKANQLIENTNYDGIIAIHKTYLSVFCVLQLKRMHRNIKTIMYLLDPIANDIDKHLYLRRVLFPLVKNKEKKAYKRIDHIINMRCNEYEPINQLFHNKIKYADFPLLSNQEMLKKRKGINNARNDEKIRFIYFGTLNSFYRSPEYLLNLLISISKRENIQVDFYCQGDCINEMKEKLSEYKDVFNIYGYISQDDLAMTIQKSDIAINLGNAMSNMVPSKLFDLILYGKPILSISKQNYDKSDSYILKYGAGLVIKESENLETASEKVLSFISSYRKGELSSAEDLETAYYENTPNFSERIIREILFAD